MDDREKWQLYQMLQQLRAEANRTLGERIDEILDRFVGTRLVLPPDHQDGKDASHEER